jgi:predicted phage terminase large subunit-like protein
MYAQQQTQNSSQSYRKTAAQELLRRREIRRSLTEWARYKGFEPAKHHQCIIENVEAFLESDEEVLLIFAPPGSAKSTYISHLLPSWYLGKYPKNQVLFGTHNGEFAGRWGRKIRNDIAFDGHILGIALSGDSTAVDRWALQSGGEYYAVGAGVGISGYRADLGLIDDLFGSREDAFSETIRRKRWDWYKDDFSARLKPGAKRILINTRWHEEDVAGLVLEQIAAGDVKGRVLEIRAEAEQGDVLGRKPGEFLWAGDANYDYPSFLKQRKRETTAMMWAALYQQRPAPEDGDFFRREWFKTHEASPKVNKFITCDFAVTDAGGDFTEFAVWGVGPDSTIYALDWWRGQTNAAEWIESLLDLVAKHKPFTVFAEGGVIRRAVEGFLNKRMDERKAWASIEWVPSIHDKPTRARGFQALAANGKVSFPKSPWAGEVIDQLIRFPAGKYDDAVDCCSLIGRAVYEAWPALLTKPEKSLNPVDRYTKSRSLAATGGWKTA